MHLKNTRNRTAAALAVVVTAALALAGCSGAAQTAPSSAASAKRGGTLTVATAYAPVSTDPTGSGVDQVNGLYTETAYDFLTRLNPDGTVSPDLATSWGYSNGNKTFRLTLRKGVKFADGTPVTADAVAKSLDYSRDNGVNNVWLSSISDVAAPTSSSVVITTSTPNDSLPSVLSQRFQLAAIISPAGLANPSLLKTGSYGAGPYVFSPTASVAGDTYTYVANKSYWDQSKIHWNKIVLKVAGTTAAALQAVENGEADMMIGDATTGSAAKSAGLTVKTASFGLSGIDVMDRNGTVVPALKDPRVRQALLYAVNRPEIQKAVYAGFATPGAGMAPKGFGAYGSDLDKAYDYDPAKAKRLLKEAGYPDGFSFNVSTINSSNTNLLAQAVVQQWAAVGIKAHLTTYSDANQMFSDLLAGKYPVAIFVWGCLTPFIDTSSFLSGGKSTSNAFDVTDPKILATLNSAKAATGAASTKLYNKAWLQAMQEGYFSNVYTRDAVVIANHDVTGVSIGSSSPLVDLPWDVLPSK